MQYKVPQGVLIEDRILPFMTLKQLIIAAIGGGIAYMLFLGLESHPTVVWLPPVGLIVVVTLAVAFLKINDIPFTRYILFVMERVVISHKRVWQQGADCIRVKPSVACTTHAASRPSSKHLSKKDLDSLTHSVDSPS